MNSSLSLVFAIVCHELEAVPREDVVDVVKKKKQNFIFQCLYDNSNRTVWRGY